MTQTTALARANDDLSLSDILPLDLTEAHRDPRINYSQDTPTKTHKAVPEECKGFEQPSCINTFIVRMIPNMQAYVGAHFPKNIEGDTRENMVDEVINNFVDYMLRGAPTRDNIPHWQLYDNNQYKLMPYYKWFLRQLDFFRRDHQRKIFRDRQMFTLSEGDYESTVETSANKAVNIESLDLGEYTSDVVENLAVSQIADYLKKLSARHSHQNNFEAHAYQLFVWKLLEESPRDIATKLGISPSAVGQWSNKLRTIVASLIGDAKPAAYVN